MEKRFKDLLNMAYGIKEKILRDDTGKYPVGKRYYRTITDIIHILEELEEKNKK